MHQLILSLIVDMSEPVGNRDTPVLTGFILVPVIRLIRFFMRNALVAVNTGLALVYCGTVFLARHTVLVLERHLLEIMTGTAFA